MHSRENKTMEERMHSQTPPAVLPRVGPAQINHEVSWENLAREAHFRPQALAEAMGVSMRTLQRYFRARYDQTVTEWLRELRLNEARHCLKRCQSVKEVAFQLGYKQPSHFTRDFKKKWGVPPRTLMAQRKLDDFAS
jgi:AraC-like DNA-binding protein